ncbi:MAG: signal recognition particle protein [Deltaproteobacteria bacterium CG_4_9_14_3_um_filter_44_9]|nr:MAG: signal recognition particle protein [Deltaproteobacteria bacterium CG2_30_43_15]PIU84245.1 MAG: signal recognition particle protein [Deltaproteobacteria bacterium CG06_land_8_20_14_3_00_44_19]PIX24491.1 MAG: signal recognition particle protein [Deltaproteobacteria bacterium CG_4_8_14_3_um_filter_43_13]PIZ18487.1 MAG: signal recognition particle protein [Deltaproteobacteria bacterium CG_4_10_14_0_8_um_filter_43_12]PJB38143.1 MAG: signal recognition particle protein [Deltaproteobacteria b
MLESLTEKLNAVFKKLRGHGKLTEENIRDVLREIRLVLLEADVNFKVVKDFIEAIRVNALGQEVLTSFTPAQQVIKIVNEELTNLLGGENSQLNLSGKPPVSIMFVGLQGSGKTTTVGKVARFLKEKKRDTYLVPADVYRPAAIDQLQKLGQDLEIDVYNPGQGEDPLTICTNALRSASINGHDVVLIDTAGRLHIDEELMQELQRIKKRVLPKEILLVADAMTGQDAVNVASKFNELIGIDGVILTKMDGDARGGAALSIKAVTNKPIKFVGTGERLDALEVFYPDRMASRILGMGDVLSLIEKAQATFDDKKAIELEKKIRKNAFTLGDFKEQIQQIKRMGSLDQILGTIPGVNKVKGIKGLQPDEGELVKIEAIINSMTKKERLNHTILNGSRRKRIAKGSGTSVQDVNKLIKNYVQTRNMIKKLNTSGMKGFKRGMLPF